jgi:hypothetical protein
MGIRITDIEMVPTVDERIAASARFSKRAVADGNGAWIVSTCEPACPPARPPPL